MMYVELIKHRIEGTEGVYIHLDIFGIGMVNLTSIIFSDFFGSYLQIKYTKKRNLSILGRTKNHSFIFKRI